MVYRFQKINRKQVDFEMVQTLVPELQKNDIIVGDTEDTQEIEEVLEELLVKYSFPIREKVIQSLSHYLQNKLTQPEYPLKIFIAYHESSPCGFVISDLNPEYKSYGRKCGTFGWLHAQSQDVCELLLEECEQFVKQHRLRKIRGPINFPKNKFGFGLQVTGNQEQLLCGVAASNENPDLYSYFLNLNYVPESEYACLKVVKESWKKGNTLDKNLKLCCLTADEVEEKLDEIVELAGDSFSSLLPDTSGGGRENVEELLELATCIPKEYFRYQEIYDPFEEYKDIPEFIEAWKEADLENMVTVFPMVLERKTNKLIGILIGVLDHYQYWDNSYVSRVNVHTAMIRREYNGKGVFSSLNNFGQATNRSMRGIDYYEGTAVWTKNSKGVNNDEAVNSIFPHCSPLRTHMVFEKRVR